MIRKDPMTPTSPLPGLTHLLEVCRQHQLLLEEEPAAHPIPIAGVPISGLPFDARLAAVHSHVGHFRIKEGFFLLRLVDAQKFDLTRVNERWRRDQPEPFRSLLVFAKEDLLACYYGTVPSLADESGVQPVVDIDIHSAPHAIPVASDVDRFFDTYARYIEALVESPCFEEDGFSSLAFPWDVPSLIAADRPLVEMLRAGRFDFLMPRNDETRRWVAQVLSAPV
jgi:hypothetical protein